VLEGHSGWIRALTAVNGYLISGSSDKIIKIWNLENFKEVFSIEGHQSCINSLTVINGCLASGSEDNTVKLWQLEY